MKLGFTGTHKGMTMIQRTQLIRLLQDLLPSEFHHGGCEGADTEASWIAHAQGIFVVCHPPINKKAIGQYFADLVLESKPYLQRNHAIVNDTDSLVATPKENIEIQRSGTWATIRYAKRCHKPIFQYC